MSARPVIRPLAVVVGFGASLLTAGCVPPPPPGGLAYYDYPDYGVEFGAPPLPLVAPPLLGPPLYGPGPGPGARPIGPRPPPGGGGGAIGLRPPGGGSPGFGGPGARPMPPARPVGGGFPGGAPRGGGGFRGGGPRR